jgi:predicted O-linked N-acetylglucosamine transferase (SPINDLY family)
MEKVGPSQEQIDSIISILSIGKFQEALEKTTILSQQYPGESLLSNISGACYQGLGQFDAAIKCYEKAITINPSYYKAHYNLGGVLQELGKLNSSIKSFERALSIKPDYAEAHNNIGNVFKELDQFDNAIKSFRRAIEIKPNYLEAHFNLGSIFQDLNNLEAAIISYERVLVIKPNFAELHNNLGVIFQGIGQLDSAQEHLEDAVRIMPDFSEAFNNLGNVFKELNQLDRAINCFNKAVAINPNFDKAHNNIGNVFKELGQFDNAIKSYEMAISTNPNYAEAYDNLGSLLKVLGQKYDAVTSYQKSLTIKPNNSEVHNNLAVIFMELGELDASIKSYETALSINPEYVEAYNNLGIALNLNGQPEEAIKTYQKALSIKSDYAEVYFNLGNLLLKNNQFDKALFNYERAHNLKPGIDFLFGHLFSTKMQLCIWDNFSNDYEELITKINNSETIINPYSLTSLIDDAEIQLKNAKKYFKEKLSKNNALSKINNYSKHAKIRIGYFSADFRVHPVSLLSAEIYELHDRSQFEVYAFSFGPDTQDEMNLRIKVGVDNFYDVRIMSNKEIALLSRSLEIDIAIDLGGFTADNRLEIFDIPAAPIQINYLGYPGTMGADFIDYIVADEVLIPADQKSNYSENIMYLPNCYMPQDSSRQISDKPITRQECNLPEDSFVFCCFNNSFKITPKEFDIWMRLLSKIDGSVLWLIKPNKSYEDNLKIEAKNRGVDPDRLIFAEKLPAEEHLARQKLADLFLDTFNFNAHTTASDALWAGLPIITITGRAFAARVASSLLTSLEVPELITTSEKEYEALALDLATNFKKLSLVKKKLADKITIAPLFDTKTYTKNLENAYTQAYERNANGLPSEEIKVS